jgi:chaperonin GroEL
MIRVKLSNKVLSTIEEKAEVLEGMNILADAVKSTLGARGRNVIIDEPGSFPIITKDGITVAKNINLYNYIQNIGVKLIKQVTMRAAEVAGDGTTTATVLAQEIINEGVSRIKSGANPIEIKNGIEFASDLVIKSLEENSKKINDDKEIEQIATISANGDKEIGEKIAEIFKKIGKTGIATVQSNERLGLDIEVLAGTEIESGYLSPYFVTNPERMIVELETPYILIYYKKLINLEAIIGLLEDLSQSAESILIIADDYENDPLQALVLNKVKAGLKVCAIKAPAFGDNRRRLLEDIAVITGGKVLKEEFGDKVADAKKSGYLGVASKITIYKDKTLIIGGGGVKEKIEQRVGALEKQALDTSGTKEKSELRQRIAKINGGVAVLKVGGRTEAEVKEKKDRVEDALCATRAALEEGIIVGGGIALFRSIKALEGMNNFSKDFMTGIDIMRKALSAPLKQIIYNTYGNIDEHVMRDLERKEYNFGFDAKDEEIKNLIEAGIIDPVKVVKTALQSAVSISSLVLTTNSIIALEERDGKEESTNI